MAALKDIYSRQFVTYISRVISEVYTKIDKQEFQREILAKPWTQFELKERMSRISDVMNAHLPEEFSEKVKILKQLIKVLRKDGAEDFNFLHIYLPEIIQKCGLNHFKSSMEALEFITVFTSAEYAIRHFYLHDFDATLKQMTHWSKNKHPLVRRLASEGSRPLLPWGIGIPKIKQNPAMHLEILENLWKDENEIVRRSVANHLNDISKLDRDITWDFVKSKLGFSEVTDKDLRHALRTLLKNGNQDILKVFAYNIEWKPKISEIILATEKIKIGERLNFKVRIRNGSSSKVKVRLEYKISFLLANQKWYKKVFQLGEVILEENSDFEKNKSHSFVPITTRTYYPGKHSISLVVNGVEYATKEFQLNP